MVCEGSLRRDIAGDIRGMRGSQSWEELGEEWPGQRDCKCQGPEEKSGSLCRTDRRSGWLEEQGRSGQGEIQKGGGPGTVRSWG